MTQLGPWEGHRRGWFAVAAFFVFGVFGGDVGMAVTSHPSHTTPAVMVPAVEPVPSAKVVVPKPSVVVTTHEVVKVLKVYVPVTPSSSSTTPKKVPTQKPTPTPTPSTHDTPVGSPTVLLTLPDPTTPTPTREAPSSSGTPSAVPSS